MTEARALARRIVAEVFDASPGATPAASAASTEAQLAGRRIVAAILAEQPPAPSTEPVASVGSEEPGYTEEQGDTGEPPLPPPNPEDRVGGAEPGPPPPPDLAAMRRPDEEPPARTGRWILVTIGAAIALALLFPLAVRAILELLSLS